MRALLPYVSEGERGFTLIEMVVTVAIMAMLATGALWLFGMHPVALRTAVDGFDQRYGEARALATKTGNGATIVFAPRANNAPGFVLSVYAGRPKDAASVSAMRLDDLAAVTSDASISGPFGSPPFAIFLSSAGKPSGKAAYPSADGSGAITFPVIAQQPSCPDQTNGIVLTFRAPNGATDTRSIGCDGNVMLSGNAAPQPSMTPEALRVDKRVMLAHWTSDTGPLHFRVGEFGYTHWFASGSVAGDARCGDSFDSDVSGSPPVVFAAGWPYQTSSPAEMNAVPVPPSLPYTWAVQQTGVPTDEPPGAFALSPVHLNGGQCTVKIVDDYGQTVTTSAHVMGDLLVTVPSPKLQGSYPSYSMTLKTTDPAQQITTGKTFDDEAIALAIGGACGGIVSKSLGSSSAGDNAHSPSLAQFTLAPQAPGTCVAHVTDQYGEPGFDINVTVQQPQKMATWPAAVKYGANGTNVALALPGRNVDVASTINAMLGGSMAIAAATCPAKAYKDAAMTQVDANDTRFQSSLGISTDANGCYNGALVAYEPGGGPSTYGVAGNTCGQASINLLSWIPRGSAAGSALGISVGSPMSTLCAITLQDANNTGRGTANNGLVTVAVTGCDYSDSSGTGSGAVDVGSIGNCSATSFENPGGCASSSGIGDGPNEFDYFGSFTSDDVTASTVAPVPTTSGPYGTLSNDIVVDGSLLNGNTTGPGVNPAPGSASGAINFNRGASGAVTIYVYRKETVSTQKRGVPGDPAVMYCGAKTTYAQVGTITIN